MDLFPTMAALTRADLPQGLALDGIDITPVLTQTGKLPERTLFWAHRNQRAVRKGPWKLLIQGNTTHLFNLADDLAEQHDRAKTDPRMVAALGLELTAWQRDVAPRG